MPHTTVPNTLEAQGLHLSAQQWGAVAIAELLGAVQARGIVRQHHAAESKRAARLAARYAIRLLNL